MSFYKAFEDRTKIKFTVFLPFCAFFKIWKSLNFTANEFTDEIDRIIDIRNMPIFWIKN